VFLADYIYVEADLERQKQQCWYKFPASVPIHQNVDDQISLRRCPELIFTLDGQRSDTSLHFPNSVIRAAILLLASDALRSAGACFQCQAKRRKCDKLLTRDGEILTSMRKNSGERRSDESAALKPTSVGVFLCSCSVFVQMPLDLPLSLPSKVRNHFDDNNTTSYHINSVEEDISSLLKAIGLQRGPRRGIEITSER
jgi:hypothetical protein